MNQLSATQARKPRPEGAWYAVVNAYQTCQRQYERLLQPFDLSIAQFDVLTTIDGLDDEAMPKDIAGRLLVTRGNVTGLLRRLQQRGLIRTRPHPRDGRARVCSLTPPGKELMRAARTAARRFIHAQMAPFSADEMAHTADLMRRMAAHLETLNPKTLAAEEVSRPDQTEAPS